jgi:hypothetical protein
VSRLHRYEGESRAKLRMTPAEEGDLNERIRCSLGYLSPEKVANYLAVPLHRVNYVRDHTPYCRIKGLRDIVQPGVRRG